MDLLAAATQFSFFLVAGTLSTGLDFTVYNFLSGAPLRWSRIRAHCVSVSLAICFSFTVNLFFVFRPDSGNVTMRAFKFLVITAISAYGIQNAVIYVTSKVWLIPVRTTIWLSRQFSLTSHVNRDFIKRNTVKALAVGTALVWNFLWYRYFVFRD